MKKVAFYTLGCKVNKYETDLMEKQFLDASYEITSFENSADVYVINSCSVTNLATRKSRQMIQRARKNNKNAVVIMCGCYSEEIKNTNSLSKISGADLVVGNEEKKQIVTILNDFKKSAKNSGCVMKLKDISKVKKYIQDISLDKGRNIRESIKIEDGCNNFCSYCIIPYTRGRVRSRPMCDIINEVRKITIAGVKEIVLVGIEIASYGTDFKENGGVSLIDVIEEIAKKDTVKRIRLRIYRTKMAY